MQPKLRTKPSYFVNGLNISSDIQLPELSENFSTDISAQVIFSLTEVPEPIFSESKQWLITEPDFQIIHMKIAGVARYLIKNGNEILVNPLPGSRDEDVRLFLLGSAFGLLLHQRGVLPLHASAISLNGRCIAFVGVSGAGKSTLAGFLNKSGYEVICDDVCALTINGQGRPVIWPGVPRIKLWTDALDALGHDSSALARDSYHENKFHLPLAMTNSEPLELSRIYELKENKNGQNCKISKILGHKKMQALANNIYRNELVSSDSVRKNIFFQCSKILKEIDIFSFYRSKKFLSMDDGLSELERHWTENVF